MNSLDRTFCYSPGCINKCGRKLSLADLNPNHFKPYLSYAIFCDASGNLIESLTGSITEISSEKEEK